MSPLISMPLHNTSRNNWVYARMEEQEQKGQHQHHQQEEEGEEEARYKTACKGWPIAKLTWKPSILLQLPSSISSLQIDCHPISIGIHVMTSDIQRKLQVYTAPMDEQEYSRSGNRNVVWTVSLLASHIHEHQLQIKRDNEQLIIRQQLVLNDKESQQDTRVYLHFYDTDTCRQCFDWIQSYRTLSKSQFKLNQLTSSINNPHKQITARTRVVTPSDSQSSWSQSQTDTHRGLNYHLPSLLCTPTTLTQSIASVPLTRDQGTQTDTHLLIDSLNGIDPFLLNDQLLVQQLKCAFNNGEFMQLVN
ncbi:hypothetical protein BDF19DRAFT_421686 [Syncephalis fuscata]|nr:hypothetical protein BDF19DRAFT_421686 [Syncephalis fuscata]